MALSGPGENLDQQYMTNYGCCVFSGGHPNLEEMLFVRAYPVILDWLHEVAMDPNYQNPEIFVERPLEETSADFSTDMLEDKWVRVPEEQKPSVLFYGQELQDQAVKVNKIEHLIRTGEALKDEDEIEDG
jgi:hypothetical protein